MKKLPHQFYDKFGILKQNYIIALSLFKTRVIYPRFFYPEGTDETLFSYQKEVCDLIRYLGFKLEFCWEHNVPLDKSDTIIISDHAFKSIQSNWRKIMFKNE